MLGDHGIYFKGPHFYDEAVRVPLIVSWPEKFRSGLQVSGLTELVDLVPTLLESAGLSVPPRVQGQSLVPHLTGQADPEHHRDSVLCEYYNSWTHGDAYGTMLRTDREKIVVYHGQDQGEFYDLERDPDEFINLWNSPEAADRKLRLMKQCFDRSVLAMDPLPRRRGPF